MQAETDRHTNKQTILVTVLHTPLWGELFSENNSATCTMPINIINKNHKINTQCLS